MATKAIQISCHRGEGRVDCYVYPIDTAEQREYARRAMREAGLSWCPIRPIAEEDKDKPVDKCPRFYLDEE